MTAWVVRAGRYGEREAWALANSCTGGGWHEMPDLSILQTREEIGEVALATYPEQSVPNYTGQLWALRGRMRPGDMMVMPLKATHQIALGRVTGGYEYRGDNPEADRRHVVPVEWIRTDLPRTSVKQDLLFTLGSAMSIFAPSKNHAAERLEKLLLEGVDPGQIPHLPGSKPIPTTSVDDVDQPELLPDVVDIASTRVTARINEEFKGHELASLVGDLLTAEGYRCTVSPPGPDFGIDIVAGRGVLGIDSPRLIVQVKSGAPVSPGVVNELHGVVNSHGADQGLLVAWEGLTGPARNSMRNLQLKIALWEAADVVDAVQRNYDQLPESTRARLRLKQVWVTSD